jgi:hypothetical protein
VQALIQVVLSAWREAERIASAREEGSPEHHAADRVAQRLHDLYDELLDFEQRDNRPEPTFDPAPAQGPAQAPP